MLNQQKKDFFILSRKINGHSLVYLDNSATTQKPESVIRALEDFYRNHNANVHRGIHSLSEEATQLYEEARENVAHFINADPHEIIFTSGATDSLNFCALSWGLKNLKKGDIVLVTEAEHHSNLVPWQMVCQKNGAVLDYLELNEDGLLSEHEIKRKIRSGVKLIALTHASNVLGTIFPVAQVSKLAKQVGALVVVDGAQAAPHLLVDVKDLDCDFYAFSGHKMLGPTGIGVLWVRRSILEQLEPYKYGGGMINTVGKTSSSWAEIPDRFEAGTPNIAGAIGLSAAVDYLKKIKMEKVREHCEELTRYALEKLSKIKEITILGPKDASLRAGLVSFTVGKIHGHDVAAVLDTKGIAVRSGHHCAMPLHTKLNIPASVRASFYVYNDKKDVDKLIDGLESAIKILG